MNRQTLQRKADIAASAVQVALAWLPTKFEPQYTDAHKVLMADYRYARRQFDQALLRDREARMNRRAF